MRGGGEVPNVQGALAHQILILSPIHPPPYGATRDILAEAMLSRTYACPPA